jgi:uncharacterized protein (DUF39 family)
MATYNVTIIVRLVRANLPQRQNALFKAVQSWLLLSIRVTIAPTCASVERAVMPANTAFLSHFATSGDRKKVLKKKTRKRFSVAHHGCLSNFQILKSGAAIFNC